MAAGTYRLPAPQPQQRPRVGVQGIGVVGEVAVFDALEVTGDHVQLSPDTVGLSSRSANVSCTLLAVRGAFSAST
jgi:hypothetical protein